LLRKLPAGIIAIKPARTLRSRNIKMMLMMTNAVAKLHIKSLKI